LLDEHAYVRRRPRGRDADAAPATARGRRRPWSSDSLGNPVHARRHPRRAAKAEEEASSWCSRATSPDGARRWVERVAARAAGRVVVTSSSPPRASAARSPRPRALVLIDPLRSPPDDVPSVGVTNWAGGVAATEHLIELGHGGIAVLRP
jgi:hypothetical protein